MAVDVAQPISKDILKQLSFIIFIILNTQAKLTVSSQAKNYFAHALASFYQIFPHIFSFYRKLRKFIAVLMINGTDKTVKYYWL